jgi:hypothetical protein
MIHKLSIAITGGASPHAGVLSPDSLDRHLMQRRCYCRIAPGNGFARLSARPADGKSIGIERFLLPSPTPSPSWHRHSIPDRPHADCEHHCVHVCRIEELHFGSSQDEANEYPI